MLTKLITWALDAEAESAQQAHRQERRSERRHDVTPAQLPIRSRRLQSVFHLKDMSAHGACGISDLPLAVGTVIFLELTRRRFHAAEVRWVRNVMVGLRFHRPIEPALLQALRRRCARDASSGRRTIIRTAFTRR